ncbi:MAG: hypothetical protein WCC64_05580, partial [Aliidongia sp.]
MISLGCLICILIAQGAAITQSMLWAVPLVGLLLVALAAVIPLAPFVGAMLLLCVLTDDLPSAGTRHSASLDLTGLIAASFILVAVGLLIRRRQGLKTAFAVGLWLCVWTAIAMGSHGASAVTVREGVREASIVAVAVIAFNARGALTTSTITRHIQLAGIASAVLALYQFMTHTGADVGGAIRSNGTFAHPNDAAVYFAVATVASLWRYFDNGRGRLDALVGVVYAAATITTFSLGGVVSLLVMIVAFGVLRSGSFRLKLGSCVAAVLIVVAFLATPLGAERVATESTTELSATSTRGPATTSLEWRLDKWQKLIPEW